MPYRNYNGKTVDELKIELDKKDKEILKLLKKKEKLQTPGILKRLWWSAAPLLVGTGVIVLLMSLIVIEACVDSKRKILVLGQASQWQDANYGGNGQVFCTFSGNYEKELQDCAIRFIDSPAVEIKCTTNGCYK